jgi:hypothetical protein
LLLALLHTLVGNFFLVWVRLALLLPLGRLVRLLPLLLPRLLERLLERLPPQV